MSNFFHAHAHSHYSALDAIPSVEDMVQMAVARKQPALALTDHGNMSGTFRLYKEAKKAGIVPFPGIEAYVVHDVADKKAPRMHLTMMALTRRGYEGLIALTSRSHERENYHFKPRIDFQMLQEASDEFGRESIVVSTGCYFGVLVQTMLASGERQARASVEYLARLFDHTYVEIQHHGIKRSGEEFGDDELAPHLYGLANDWGFPILITQDSHYVDKRHKPYHDLLKRMVIHTEGEDDAAFPGDAYHLASTRWVQDHYERWPQMWEDSLQSMEWLLEDNDLVLPAADTYQLRVPSSGHKDPNKILLAYCRAEMTKRGLMSKVEYAKRLSEELEVIEHHGMADYFLLVADYVEWCRNERIMVNARGSANGSLVCYLLGITQLDPIKWGLMFERFLSRDRSKPPDIDMDIEDISRGRVIEYISKRHHVCQIGTYNRLGQDQYGKGSILVQYLSYKRRTLSPERFRAGYGDVKYIEDLERIDPKEAHMLRELAGMGVKKSAGAHAAGFVVSGKDQPLSEYLPTMLIPSSGTTVTQPTMDDVEDMGYVKIDLLGLRQLTTVRRTLELLGRDPMLGLDWIPDDDKHTLAFMRKGRSDTGIFQFEGYTNAKGCRELGVRSTRDCILVTALYRPATMNMGYKDEFLSNRAGTTKPHYPHPIFEKHLARTHGVAVFQEQIMAILRDVGVPNEELNLFLKALKMSNDKAARAREIFRDSHDRFVQYMMNMGTKRDEAEEAWDMVSGFAGYGFNEAHGAAYGLLGYRTAYLKVHHPLEFMAATLITTAGTPKEDIYVKEARRMGLELLPADVNYSEVLWTLDKTNDGIRRGLLSIKGIGAKAAEAIVAGQPYTSVDDFIDRTPGRVVTGGNDWPDKKIGVMKTLAKSGALMSLGVDPWTV